MSTTFQTATMEELRGLPAPESLGPRHRPVPHAMVVEALRKELTTRGLTPTSTKWELSSDGMRLDGRIGFAEDKGKKEAQRAILVASRKETYTGINEAAVQALLPPALRGSFGMVLTVTHANDKSRALRIASAVEVFVCNNLAVGIRNGASIVRKHTGDEPWEPRLQRLLERALAEFQHTMIEPIVAMQGATLSDQEAKALIYDALSLRWPPLAPSAFKEVGATYFAHATADVAEANRWSLHNAFTQHMKELPQKRQIETGTMLTELFTRDLLAVEPGAGLNPN